MPDEEYTQIVSNQAFLEFEEEIMKEPTHLSTNLQLTPENLLLEDEPWHNYSLTQYRGIEHRSMYELLNAELESRRVYGIKGRPFPW